MKNLLFLLLLVPLGLFAQTGTVIEPKVNAQILQGLDSSDFVRTNTALKVSGGGVYGQILQTDGAGGLSWVFNTGFTGINNIDATNISQVALERQSDTLYESFDHVHTEYELVSNFALGAMGFADSLVTIPMTQNNYFHVTNGTNNLYNVSIDTNVTIQGDSITIQSAGYYTLHWDLSFYGANTDRYHISWFLNGVEQEGFGEAQRGMTSTTTGVGAASTAFLLSAGDDLRLTIKNTQNNNDATVRAGNIIIEKIR